jgi:hypothetical protein
VRRAMKIRAAVLELGSDHMDQRLIALAIDKIDRAGGFDSKPVIIR